MATRTMKLQISLGQKESISEHIVKLNMSTIVHFYPGLKAGMNYSHLPITRPSDYTISDNTPLQPENQVQT
jgi:hypothetical protein